jgi:hypothetical protein
MKASGKMSVERFEQEFEKEFGVRIEIKQGNRLADDKARLASLRPKDYKGPKTSDFEVSGRMHVGNVKAKLEELFGVTADLYSGRRIAPDDVTLAALRRGDVGFEKKAKKDDSDGLFDNELTTLEKKWLEEWDWSEAPEEVKKSKRFAFEKQSIEYSDESVKSDKAFITEFFKSGAYVSEFSYVSDSLKSNSGFMLEMLKIDTSFFNYLSEDQKANEDLQKELSHLMIQKLNEFDAKLKEVDNSTDELSEKIVRTGDLGIDYIDKSLDILISLPASEDAMLDANAKLYDEYSEVYLSYLKSYFNNATTWMEYAKLFNEFRPKDRWNKAGWEEEIIDEIVTALNDLEIPENIDLDDLYYEYLNYISEEHYQVPEEKLSQFPTHILSNFNQYVYIYFDEGMGKILSAFSEEEKEELKQKMLDDIGEEEFNDYYLEYFENNEEDY